MSKMAQEAAAELRLIFSPSITGWQGASEVTELNHISLGTEKEQMQNNCFKKQDVSVKESLKK